MSNIINQLKPVGVASHREVNNNVEHKGAQSSIVRYDFVYQIV